MKNITIKAHYWFYHNGSISSCKNFLEQEVPGALPEQNFYKTDLDATQATTAVYDLMQAHYNYIVGKYVYGKNPCCRMKVMPVEAIPVTARLPDDRQL